MGAVFAGAALPSAIGGSVWGLDVNDNVGFNIDGDGDCCSHDCRRCICACVGCLCRRCFFVLPCVAVSGVAFVHVAYCWLSAINLL